MNLLVVKVVIFTIVSLAIVKVMFAKLGSTTVTFKKIKSWLMKVLLARVAGTNVGIGIFWSKIKILFSVMLTLFAKSLTVTL